MILLLAAAVLCGGCHPDIVSRWERTPMGRTSGPVVAASEPTGSFVQEASGIRFDIVRAGQNLELRSKAPTQLLGFFIGSGRMGRSYTIVEDGYLYQAPVGYYANRKAWAMAPGYEHDRVIDLSRPIGADCLFCHATGARTMPGTLNRVADLSALRGISCERCHGEGMLHANRPRKDNIVNPANLSAAERDSVCEQCHLSGEVRLALAGKSITDYKPGQRLSDYVDVFVNAASGSVVRVNSHADALARSRCREASGGSLWCGTCHSVHSPSTDYRARCMACHDAPKCAPAKAKGGDCVGCHMPKSRAADGGHTVFTDHSIRARPANNRPEEPVRQIQSYFNRSLPQDWKARNLGIAYSEMGRKSGRPDWLEKAWPLLREAAGKATRDPDLYTRIGSLLQAGGHNEQALPFYEKSLEWNADQMEALLHAADLLDAKGSRKEAADLRGRAERLCPRAARKRP